MRIGVISDTHLKVVPKEFLEGLRTAFQGVDLVFHCGDWVSIAVLEAIAAQEWEILGVAGNMDPPEIHGQIPVKREVELEGRRIGLVHGWGAPGGIENRVKGIFQEVDVVVFGHTHKPFWAKLGEVWLFNPGSAAGWGNPQGPTVGILDVGEEIKANVVRLRGAA